MVEDVQLSEAPQSICSGEFNIGQTPVSDNEQPANLQAVADNRTEPDIDECPMQVVEQLEVSPNWTTGQEDETSPMVSAEEVGDGGEVKREIYGRGDCMRCGARNALVLKGNNICYDCHKTIETTEADEEHCFAGSGVGNTI